MPDPSAQTVLNFMNVEKETLELGVELFPVAAYMTKKGFNAARSRIEQAIRTASVEGYPNKQSILRHITVSIPESEYKDDYTFRLDFTPSFLCPTPRHCLLTDKESLTKFLP
jgi:hypothetical protein